MPRLFVAVWPPAELVRQLRRIDRPERKGLRWTTEDQWHVTLRFLGRVDHDHEESVVDALAAAATSLSPATAVAGPGPRGLGPSAWVLPVDGLAGVARAVGEATASIGEQPPRRPFRGHLTLARARLPAARSGLPTPELAANWPVAEITLVRSDLRPDGARYEVVGRWTAGSG